MEVFQEEAIAPEYEHDASESDGHLSQHEVDWMQNSHVYQIKRS